MYKNISIQSQYKISKNRFTMESSNNESCLNSPKVNHLFIQKTIFFKRINSIFTLSCLFYDESILLMILNFNVHKDIAKWVQVCKKIYQTVKIHIPEFFHIGHDGNDWRKHLFYFSKCGNLKGVKYCLHQDSTVVNDHRGLESASKYGHLEIVKYLFSKTGHHPFVKHSFLLAVLYKHLEIVKYFVSQGVDIQLYAETIISYASTNGDLPMIKYFISQGLKMDEALIEAIKCGHFQLVQYLVQQGVDIHQHDELALCLATMYGHLDMVRFLVSQGANFHYNEEKALRLASKKGYYLIVKYLVEQGANVRAKKDSALKWALKNNHQKIAEYLISQGCDAPSSCIIC